MNASPNKVERRKHFDSTARITYATCAVRGNCELVRVDSLKHAAMLAFGFEQLDATDGSALMLPPIGWGNA